jgi:acetyl-CoA carboxylase biotin carboxyl carrier protein
MGLTPEDLRELLAAFEESTWREMSVSVAGDTLHVSRRDASPAAAAPSSPAPSAPAPDTSAAAAATSQAVVDGSRPAAAAPPAAQRDASGTPVLAPSIGLFWRAPNPGAPPFVEVGTRVGPEDTIGIVEVMKLMNRVPAGTAGVVTAVLVTNGGMVEHGQPLVLIDPS